MNNQDLENIIVVAKAGSHAYGTNTPTSDEDVRGIFVARPEQIRTPFFPVREVSDESAEDTKYFELNHYMKLTLGCNPNVIELLWTHPDDILSTTPAYELLRSHRDSFLSKKIFFTTTGYAHSQLKRIMGHNKWLTQQQHGIDRLRELYLTNKCTAEWMLTNFDEEFTSGILRKERPKTGITTKNQDAFFKDINLSLISNKRPRQIDFVSLLFNFTTEKMFTFDLEDYKDGYRLIPYSGDIYGVYRVEGYQTFDYMYNLNTKYEKNEGEGLGSPLYLIKFNSAEYKTALEKYNNYWKWRNNRNEKRHDLEAKYGYDCYSDDTEFLTNNGWKKFDDVLVTDTLATFNENHHIIYQFPTERIDSTFTGNMYHLTGYHVDTFVTSNHNMYVKPYSRATKQEGKWGFERAAELSETFDTLNVIQPKKNRQLLPKGFNIQLLEEIDLLSYLKLIGWYVSDGTMNFYPDGKVKHMMISQSKPQSKLSRSLNKQILNKEIQCNEYTYDPNGIAKHPETRWVFKRTLSQFIYNDCGHLSKNKRLPEWCFFLTKREMTTLLIALIQGDGTKKDHQTHTYVYYTINKMLADDVQRLAFLCGFETSLYGPYPLMTKFSSDNNMYQIHINMRPIQTRRHVRSSSVKKIPVINKRIVCFMVPNYTLVTRRNGHIGLHGNTKHASHLIRLMKMANETLTTGEVFVKRPDAQELLDIRNGKFTYDEIIKYADELEKSAREAYDNCTILRHSPDFHLAAKVTMEVQDLIWNNK